MCEDPALYSSDTLKGNERREIKRAGGIFEISLVTDITAFKTQAYPVYRSFYERTNYNYKAERRYEDKFSKWADTVFRHPKVVVLGAYKKDRQLGAIGICYLVEGTLLYATFFCDVESLKMHAAGFMLHTVREAAARCPAIKDIFIGSYKYSMARGVDDFYHARGCKLVRKTAWLQLNPVAMFGLKRFAPQQYDRLIGAIPAARLNPVNIPATLSPKLENQAIAGVPKSAESDNFTPPAAHG